MQRMCPGGHGALGANVSDWTRIRGLGGSPRFTSGPAYWNTLTPRDGLAPDQVAQAGRPPWISSSSGGAARWVSVRLRQRVEDRVHQRRPVSPGHPMTAGVFDCPRETSAGQRRTNRAPIP